MVGRVLGLGLLIWGAQQLRVPAGIRVFQQDGHVLYVGTSAAANQVLTFEQADPQDWWFHVHGSKGAHVVVHPPHHQTHLPTGVLSRALRLARRYSQAGALSPPVWQTRVHHLRATQKPGQVRFQEPARIHPSGFDPVEEDKDVRPIIGH